MNPRGILYIVSSVAGGGKTTLISLLLEKHPTCQLSKKEYITLIDSGYSFEILSGLYNNKVSLEVDSKGKTTLI